MHGPELRMMLYIFAVAQAYVQSGLRFYSSCGFLIPTCCWMVAPPTHLSTPNPSPQEYRGLWNLCCRWKWKDCPLGMVQMKRMLQINRNWWSLLVKIWFDVASQRVGCEQVHIDMFVFDMLHIYIYMHAHPPQDLPFEFYVEFIWLLNLFPLFTLIKWSGLWPPGAFNL